MVEQLPSIHEVLVSIYSTKKKQPNKKVVKEQQRAVEERGTGGGREGRGKGERQQRCWRKSQGGQRGESCKEALG